MKKIKKGDIGYEEFRSTEPGKRQSSKETADILGADPIKTVN